MILRGYSLLYTQELLPVGTQEALWGTEDKTWRGLCARQAHYPVYFTVLTVLQPHAALFLLIFCGHIYI